MQAEVWGIAYQVAEENITEVKEYLAWREKAGYEPMKALFYPDSPPHTEAFQVDVFISPQTDNPHYVGPETIEEIAEKVR